MPCWLSTFAVPARVTLSLSEPRKKGGQAHNKQSDRMRCLSRSRGRMLRIVRNNRALALCDFALQRCLCLPLAHRHVLDV
jgi:hypothetical protein